MRLALGASLVVAIVSGLVGGAGGLGSFLALTQSSGNADQTYAVILFLGIIGVSLSRLLVRGQRRLIFWSGR
jgi:ABC-type nitrate/sulfonate/bicarbonate transport system permease component